jgi:hypothetical protein
MFSFDPSGKMTWRGDLLNFFCHFSLFFQAVDIH